MGATRPDNDSLDNPSASFLGAKVTCLLVGTVVVLEVSLFSLNVSVIGHRVSA